MSPPLLESKNKPSKLTMWLCLPLTFMLVPCSTYSLTLKMETVCSSETSFDYQRTTLRYIPEDSTFQATGFFNLWLILQTKSGFNFLMALLN
jgi:hypothetical protein